MSIKLSTDEILMVINQNVKDKATKEAILTDLKAIEAEKQAEKEDNKADAPKAKNKHVFFIRKDEKGNYAEAGFLAKVPQTSDNGTVLKRIQSAAIEQNRNAKREKAKVKTYPDFFQGGGKRKFTKNHDIQPVKELIEIVILPTEEIDFN
jgi:hypothetical protein